MTTLMSPQATPEAFARTLIERLETDGLVGLPRLVTTDTLQEMQSAFAGRLRHMRWNNADGYERTERWRFMIQDVLTLAQGFVDVAVHPVVEAVLREYIGPGYTLCEAKGWRSQPTPHDFHGWHGDIWYDQALVTSHVPCEVKLAVYLTDVDSGAFQYIPGTHGRPPRHLSRAEAAALPLDRLQEVRGPAGTAFLFDSSCIHRQGIPILEPRQAIFYNYHDPAIPLQREDLAYYRYHPLLLNAAFLGGLSAEDQRVLGFGDKTNYQPDFARRAAQPVFPGVVQSTHALGLILSDWSRRALAKAMRLLCRSSKSKT